MTESPLLPIPVAAVGMVCSVGLNARAACAAVRAHVAGFKEVPFFDSRGERVVAAAAETAVQGKQGYFRIVALLRGALADCIGGDLATQARILRTVPCLVVLGSDDRVDYPDDVAAIVCSTLASDFGELHQDTRVVRGGPAGFFRALSHARTLLTQVPACIVVAADSLINRRMLTILEGQGRLKTDENSDGVIPGEAAAALWLSSYDRPDGLPVLARIDGIGIATEPSALQTDLPNKGTGLAAAMRYALRAADVPLSDVDFRIAGLTGQRLDFVEASVALARIQRVHRDDFELWAPAEQIGDVGAALPACLTVVASVAFARGYSPGRRALMFCSSDRGERAAAVLSGPSE